MSNLVVYEGDPHTGNPVFVRRCPKCSRFTTADECKFVWREGHPAYQEYAKAWGRCKKHGRVELVLVMWD